MFRVPVVIRQEANLMQELLVSDYVFLLLTSELSLQNVSPRFKGLG
jgi:hypothetical protein